MAKLPRVFYKRFGADGPTDDFAIFGSQTEGDPEKTKGIAEIQSLDPWLTGWKNAINAANRAPYLEDMNGFCLVDAYMTAYMFQEGVPEWDGNTEYHIGSIVKKAGTDQLYSSLIDDNAGNALPNQVDNANWRFCPFLLDNTVTSAKIGPNAVIAGKLANGAVDTTARIADNIITNEKMVIGAVCKVRNVTNVAGGEGPIWANNLINLAGLTISEGSSILIYAVACISASATGGGRLDLDMAVFRAPTFDGPTLTGGILVQGAFSRISEVGIGGTQFRLMNMSLVGIEKNLSAGTYQYALGAGISNGEGTTYGGPVFYNLVLVEQKRADVA